MNTRNTKLVSLHAALAASLFVGLPVIADDTELLIVDPSATVSSPPNIMFIVDSSGSMNDPVDTTAPYNSAQTYSTGACDTDRIYWTTLDVTPSCAGAFGAPNTQWIPKSDFLCADAKLRMSGIGAYTGVMVQYRGATGAERWQQIEIGNNADAIECQQDNGDHGDGTSSTELWAQAGTGTTQFTNDANLALTWGSGDAAQVYTMYDGNYLNWRENPVIVSLPKIDIVKAVSRNLMNAIEDVNVGLMRFTGGAGGRVLHDISDINTSRGTILNTINNINAGGSTPLAETLYEAALYWRGMGANYGQLQLDGTTGLPIGDIDPTAFVGGLPGNYERPATPVCSSNYNVLLSDGIPTSDTGVNTLAPALPGFAGAMGGATACDGGTGDGACLDDIAEYLSVADLNATDPGLQTVTTHTIGFAINLPILETTANRSGGDYYEADDVETLTTTLLRIVENILDKGLSFAAPAVAVNTFNRTQNLNDLYISTFLPDSRVHWPGNLKKYSLEGGVIRDASTPAIDAVDPATGFFASGATSFWTLGGADGNDVLLGGAANRLPTPATRNVYTNYGFSNNLIAGSNAITPSNTSLTTTDFGLTGAPGEPSVAEVTRWARGEDVLDEDNDPATTQRFAMGDPLHSQPAAVVYGGTMANPDVVVFTATNDGYLHAVNGDTGVELWSFIPKDLLPDLPELMLNGNSTYKHYGIDGDVVPVVADIDGDGIINNSDFVYLLFGMRRGGNKIYALDVTDRNNPVLKWEVSHPNWGQSWSRPVVTRVDMDLTSLNSNKAVVIVGNGYDTVHDTAALPATADGVGAGISMLDLETGARVWQAAASGAELNIPAMTRSFPSQVRAIDFSGDGFTDRMYAVDVGGQVFRFDVFRNETPANTVTGGVIARFGGEGVSPAGTTDTRRFYSPPDVSIFSDPVLNRRFLAVGVGSGYRAHPLDVSASDAYYSLRDPDVFAKLTQPQYNTYNVALDANMVDVSGQVRTVIGPTDRGWKFSLPAGQMVLSASATFDNSVFFLGFSPDIAAAATCQVAPGNNFLYRVDVANGDPVANNLDTMTPAESNAARVTALQQGGIAPTPAFLFPGEDPSCTGDDCGQPPIGCVGVECFDPGFANNPVRTLWTQDGIE